MIEITRTPLHGRDWQVKVVGVGGAGSHAVDRLSKDGYADGDLIVANTDARALSSCTTANRINLGQRLTRGLGAGGDPDLGHAAVEESLSAVSEQLAGASMLLLLTGLGGGTGSGGAPRIAQIAREQGAHVIVLATLPFSFEGKRRSEQAAQGLAALRAQADLVICFENDRMSSLVDAAAGIEEAFGTVDALLAQTVRAIVSMTKGRSLLHSGIDEIAAALSGSRSCALFGFGSAEGDDRVREALAKALASPLFEGSGRLQAASGVWMYVAGGSDLRWAEVQLLTTELSQRLSQDVRLFFGAAVDPHLSGSVTVTLLAGVPCADEAPLARLVEATVRESVVVPLLEHSEYTQAPAPVLEVIESGEVLVECVEAELEVALVEPFVHEELEAVAIPVQEESVMEEITTQPEGAPVPQTEEVSEMQRTGTPPPPYERAADRAAEMRRDIGASFLKRRLLAREAVVPQDGGQTEAVAKPKNLASLDAPTPVEAEPQVPVLTPPPVVSAAVSEVHEEPILAAPVASARKKPAQEQMHFEPVNRGRFEKTDPTMVDGQDLDVPTFLRRKVSIGGDGSHSSTGH